MSRSIKKHPYCGMTYAPSEKLDKSKANRRLRRITRSTILPEDQDFALSLREVSDRWCFAKDGKQRSTHPGWERK